MKTRIAMRGWLGWMALGAVLVAPQALAADSPRAPTCDEKCSLSASSTLKACAKKCPVKNQACTSTCTQKFQFAQAKCAKKCPKGKGKSAPEPHSHEHGDDHHDE
ncbi:hypothetical protein [Corallococcus aberystwythensis]|nr:hypothetical protein [Corallococcus aberystwythensis]